MKMKTQTYIRSFLCLALLVIINHGCINDLDTLPLDPETSTANNLFKDPNSYISVLAKLYGGLALSGQSGPADNPDIEGLDEGAVVGRIEDDRGDALHDRIEQLPGRVVGREADRREHGRHRVCGTRRG